MLRIVMVAGLLAGSASLTSADATDDNTVEVLHWLTSGGEAAALSVLKKDLEAQGIAWQDMPVAGGGGEQAMTVLKARVTSGNPPTSVQLLGYDVQDWAKQGVLADLSDVASKEGWDKLIPAAEQKFTKYDGKWVSVPIEIHSANWIWGNKAILDKLGLEPPKTWDEFIVALDKIKGAGYTALAIGGQPWQETEIFDNVVNATGGPEFYKKALIDLDPAALGSDTMKEVFDRIIKLKSYADPNFSGRDWNLATAMVINGKAGFQIMGDWAKGEFINAKQIEGKDFTCSRFPGSQGSVIFSSDQFVMFKVADERRHAQLEMASAILSPTVQSGFSVLKGSVPARLGVSDAGLDECGKESLREIKEASDKGTLIGSFTHSYAATAAPMQAGYDVVAGVFTGQYDSVTAVKALVKAITAEKD
jgi:glucose/mannose transport system substrate-binding protein